MAQIRESIAVDQIDMTKCYFNPGCAMSAYKPEVPDLLWKLLRDNFGDVKFHSICCRHNPQMPEGATVIVEENKRTEFAEYSFIKYLAVAPVQLRRQRPPARRRNR